MSLDSSQQVNKIVLANNEVNLTWVLRYHKCFQLWITVEWPRSYINHSCLNALNVVRTSCVDTVLGNKWKAKHSERTLKSLFKKH